jgi:hypothetical protein
MHAKRRVRMAVVAALLALVGGLGLTVIGSQPASACEQYCPLGDAQPAAYEHTPDDEVNPH